MQFRIQFRVFTFYPEKLGILGVQGVNSVNESLSCEVFLLMMPLVRNFGYFVEANNYKSLISYSFMMMMEWIGIIPIMGEIFIHPSCNFPLNHTFYGFWNYVTHNLTIPWYYHFSLDTICSTGLGTKLISVEPNKRSRFLKC